MSDALVRGGKYFVEPTEATVSGSTFGGCMLKANWVGVGLRIEIYANGQCLVTTPVQLLRVEQIHNAPKHLSLEQPKAVC